MTYKNEKSRTNFKNEFKKRLYDFTLKLIKFLDKLPEDNVSRRIGDQLLRSGTSIIGNYIEGQAARKILPTSLIPHLNQQMKVSYGSHYFVIVGV